MSSYFITSTGTGVGKTFCTAALTHYYTRGGYPVRALKPVISGYDAADDASDTALLLRAANIPASTGAIDAISPWRFALPASPHFAARAEQRFISLNEVVEFCKRSTLSNGITFIEGAGGVMAPLNETHTMLDLMHALPSRIMLVVGSYLGSISHTLTALAVLPAEKLHAVVVTEGAENCAGLAATREAILQFAKTPVPVYTVPRAPAAHDPWKHANLPGELCKTLV